MTRTAKPICFYLPQFHQIPENDRWWGKGFTEWTLTQAAKPLFENHRQPRMPSTEVGYYNLLDPTIRRRQGELARAHGIYGFSYYHYWFRGKTLLERPLELMLEDGYPDLPFCLCWANEPWSRRWTGEDRDVLQPQDYGDAKDWDDHFEYLSRFFHDPRYIRVGGNPMFLIYRLGHIGEPERMITHWRERARASGFGGLHLVAVEGGVADNRIGPVYVDAVAEHHPTCLLDQARPIVKNSVAIIPVEQLWSIHAQKPQLHRAVYPGACHAWDNTPRRGRHGVVVLPSTPRRYAAYLQTLCERVVNDAGLSEPFLFLNAWNEWSEGAFLEPDERDGRRWLGAVADAVAGTAPPFEPSPSASEQDLAADQSSSGADRFSQGRTLVPDVDFLFAVISQGTRGESVLELGCDTAATSEHLRWLFGASRYIGLEPNPAWIGPARNLLAEVHSVDPDRFDLTLFDLAPGTMDVVICRDLLGHVADPVATCLKLFDALRPGGTACLGVPHAGASWLQVLFQDAQDDTAPAVDLVVRHYTLAQTKALLDQAGLQLLKLFRVFGARSAALQGIKDTANTLAVGRHRITELTRSQMINLACDRFVVFARKPMEDRDTPIAQGNPRKSLPDRALRTWQKSGRTPANTESFRAYRPLVNTVISPHDTLFPHYQHSESAEAYFDSALGQLDVFDQILAAHASKGLTELTNIADYACHYGRLLRALRAINPQSVLYAYDIDPQATEFCRQHFDCRARTVGWDPKKVSLEATHQLVICLSLLTHTDRPFYPRVLNLWARMLVPGGLLCFTYLGASYLNKWLLGELDHYGQVEPQIRQRKAQEYAEQGHVYAPCDTAYSVDGQYGIGFMSESTVRDAIDLLPQLEYMQTLPGDTNGFGQDMAIVRKSFH